MLISITTPEDMFALGAQLAKDHTILLLQGELGAGKTTLIKGFAQGLGISAAMVNSPTYTYVQEYNNMLLHIDMYNIKSFDELVQKGIVDLIHNYRYVVIERPKYIDLIGIGGTHISIKKIDTTTREVSIVS